MAEEREVNTPSGIAEKFDFKNMSPEQMQALAVEVLDRGVNASRFNVNLPPDLHGEWVPRDTLAVRDMQSMGFEVDKKYANEVAIKSQSGPEGNVIGDVIFMTCPKAWKDILDAEKQKRFVTFHGMKIGDKVKGQAEEKNYTDAAKTLDKFGIGHFESSTTTVAPATELNKT
jgi:hypothetical protein